MSSDGHSRYEQYARGINVLSGDMFKSVVYWAGWETTLQSLQDCGWEIWSRTAYRNWRMPTSTGNANHKIYILNTEFQQLGRISYKQVTHAFHLDYLMPCKRYTGRIKQMFEELGEDDIEWLQEEILNIQAKRPKKQSKLKSDVIPYDKAKENFETNYRKQA
jgi:hypothetical protein